MRQIVMVGFLQAQNCTNLVSSWRHPDSRTDTFRPDYYRRIGQVLEAGKFHMGFFDDRLAMPDRMGGDHAHTVKYGIRCVKLDPVAVLMTMGMATERLGLGATCSTTYYEPFHVARQFQTVDLMTNGRAAWNVVTSMNDGEALNMGHDAHGAHDRRYDRADEFMEVVRGHWDGWEDDAVVCDKDTGLYAHPDKVHRLDHKGEFFNSRGPFTVPRSPQGHPVIIQAGQSARGKRFSARWGEVVFVTGYPTLEMGQREYAEFKAMVEANGRDPDSVTVTPSVYTVVADTRSEAEDKMALNDKLFEEVDALSLLSEALNFDFASKAMDEPFTDDELENISGTQSMRDRVLQVSGIKNPTVRDFIKYSGRARPRNPFVGDAKDVADKLEEWFVSRACDGYVLAADNVPGSYEDFVRLVVPELQKRGLYHKDYKGATLRENLGLEIPRHGEWKQ
ncbi:MAG: LLM class flavin-dependent oxidoreductase [Chromatiales bacterium]|jgi:FMN-dependent oxidoreductase (nitrilotriacetate monooxygenase family)|nr:LLM class flavin-dependent oxidoreductase [Chromatiales bacterium]